jgi:hypothetical protein
MRLPMSILAILAENHVIFFRWRRFVLPTADCDLPVVVLQPQEPPEKRVSRSCVHINLAS